MPALRVRDLTVEFGSGGEVTRPLDRFAMLLAGLMDRDRVMVIATHDDRVHALGGQRVHLAHRPPA